jgi:hypothetical protein
MEFPPKVQPAGMETAKILLTGPTRETGRARYDKRRVQSIPRQFVRCHRDKGDFAPIISRVINSTVVSTLVHFENGSVVRRRRCPKVQCSLRWLLQRFGLIEKETRSER